MLTNPFFNISPLSPHPKTTKHHPAPPRPQQIHPPKPHTQYTQKRHSQIHCNHNHRTTQYVTAHHNQIHYNQQRTPYVIASASEPTKPTHTMGSQRQRGNTTPNQRSTKAAVCRRYTSAFNPRQRSDSDGRGSQPPIRSACQRYAYNTNTASTTQLAFPLCTMPHNPTHSLTRYAYLQHAPGWPTTGFRRPSLPLLSQRLPTHSPSRALQSNSHTVKFTPQLHTIQA